jgi:hypothetical protein
LTSRKDLKGRKSRMSWESLTRVVLTVKLVAKKGVLLRMTLLLLSKKWTQRMS